MISELSVGSLYRMEAIGEAFAKEATYPGGFSLAAFTAGWVPLLAGGTGKLLAFEKDGEIVGALGMAFMPDFFSGKPTALELFWYVLDSHRKTDVGLDLFHEFERQGKIHRVKQLIMVHLVNLAPDKLRAFYESRGYVKVEETYRKELN